MLRTVTHLNTHESLHAQNMDVLAQNLLVRCISTSKEQKMIMSVCKKLVSVLVMVDEQRFLKDVLYWLEYWHGIFATIGPLLLLNTVQHTVNNFHVYFRVYNMHNVFVICSGPTLPTSCTT